MSEKKLKVNLTLGAVALLRSVLATRWSEDATQIYRCGMLLENNIHDCLAEHPEPKPPFKVADPATMNVDQLAKFEKHEQEFAEWSKGNAELNLSVKEFSDVGACLQHYVEKGSFSPTKEVCQLLKEFDIVKGE